jgi:hypothetical protein
MRVFMRDQIHRPHGAHLAENVMDKIEDAVSVVGVVISIVALIITVIDVVSATENQPIDYSAYLYEPSSRQEQ